MKKRLFTILSIALGVASMVSCSSDNSVPVSPVDTVVNQKILEIMQSNYLWTPNNVALNQEAPAFFNSLLSPNDKYQSGDNTYTYSGISKVGEATGASYDPGFEYAINKYEGGLTYYVIYYVKQDTDAANYLGRGMYITKVNNEAVSAANASTLLKKAYSAGADMKLTILTPLILEEKTFTIKPKANLQENPLLVANANVATSGSKRVGYIAYNHFSSGANGAYDNALANKLNEFKDVTVLVLDLRYNPGGGMATANILGSALVKNRDTSKPFMYEVKRADLNKDAAHNYLDKTAGGVAIPKLGDQLSKVYIITGQNTNGATSAFVNAMKTARPDVVVYGEKTKGQNVLRGTTTVENQWNLVVAMSYMADANKKYNYTAGITPSVVVQEVQENASLKNTMLAALGSKDEIILSRILTAEGITVTRSASLFNVEGVVSTKAIRSSLSDKANGYNIVELDVN